MNQSPVTIVILISTVLTSLAAFQSPAFMSQCLMSPWMIRTRKEYYRFFLSGLVHVDFIHLAVNMFVFWQFGRIVELYFHLLFQKWAALAFIALYILGIIVADIPSYFKHRNNPGFAAIGASGAVSAILFSFCLMNPLAKISLYGVFPMPAVVWGLAYLLYSAWMSRRGGDRVNHDAHLYGALFGVVFTAALHPDFVLHFIDNLGFSSR